jgi:hypothetical protein
MSMNQIEQIEERLQQLSIEKQIEVLDFVAFLQQQAIVTHSHPPKRSLREHPAFGSWHGRDIDAVDYQRAVRSEWRLS